MSDDSNDPVRHRAGKGPQHLFVDGWPPGGWESPWCPPADRPAAVLAWLAEQLEYLEVAQNHSPQNHGAVIRDAYRLLRHLRTRQMTAVADDDPTIGRPEWSPTAYEAHAVLGRLRERLAAEAAQEF